LGSPGSGKTTLLKAIAGRLSVKKGEKISGSVSYNGKTFEDKTTFHIDNAIAFIDQLDRHEPRLTVDETFEFAFQCKRGGTHFDVSENQDTKEILEIARKADAERLLINMTLVSLGLDHVRDTFVGDDVVRGVSGGQRRRVTVGEMLMDASPIMCGDEISNGLDASSCYEIIQILSHLSKDTKKTRVISLLQPSPETVSLFDEVILLAEGNLLFAGPISKVEDYFAALGYKAPRHVDVADFLQLLTTADAEKLYEPSPAMAETRSTPYTAAELAELFRNSALGERIKEQLQAPFQYVWASARDKVEQHDGADHLDDRMLQNRYANSFHRSVWLNLKRNITVWTRNRRVLIANAAKNIIMGVSVGGVFWQTDDVVSILGVLFQGMLFIMLGKNGLHFFSAEV
jgi:ABC-type multidrug transport system ATPase subunit